MSKYGISKNLQMTFDEAVVKTTEELAKEGFGILTEIDVKAKMKEKIGKEMDNYIILGACNPPLAFDAIQAEQEVGLMLPCNVIVYEKDDKVYVSAIKPSVAMSMIENPDLAKLAIDVEEKLKKVIDSV